MCVMKMHSFISWLGVVQLSVWNHFRTDKVFYVFFDFLARTAGNPRSC